MANSINKYGDTEKTPKGVVKCVPCKFTVNLTKGTVCDWCYRWSQGGKQMEGRHFKK